MSHYSLIFYFFDIFCHGNIFYSFLSNIFSGILWNVLNFGLSYIFNLLLRDLFSSFLLNIFSYVFISGNRLIFSNVFNCVVISDSFLFGNLFIVDLLLVVGISFLVGNVFDFCFSFHWFTILYGGLT